MELETRKQHHQCAHERSSRQVGRSQPAQAPGDEFQRFLLWIRDELRPEQEAGEKKEKRYRRGTQLAVEVRVGSADDWSLVVEQKVINQSMVDCHRESQKPPHAFKFNVIPFCSCKMRYQ